MATVTVSTDGKYKVISSSNATLATAIADVINTLEDHHVANNQIQFNLTHTGSAYAYTATVRLK